MIKCEIKYYEIELKSGKIFIVKGKTEIVESTINNYKKDFLFAELDNDKKFYIKYDEIVYIKELSDKEYAKIKQIKDKIDNLKEKINKGLDNPISLLMQEDLEEDDFMKFINQLKEKKTNDW